MFALGDGAFKFSYDKEISNLPIIEFFPADRVDFEYSRGRLTAVVFKTKHKIRDRDYTLKEHYEKKEIYYTLENKDGKEVEITAFDEFTEYIPVKNKAEFIAAVPVIFRPSNQFEGRGMSIFHNKIDAYDSLDEIWSQWMLAVRKGQIKTFVPEQYLPRDTKTGEALGYNDFDNDFISYSPGMSENDNSKITTSQGQIQSEERLRSGGSGAGARRGESRARCDLVADHLACRTAGREAGHHDRHRAGHGPRRGGDDGRADAHRQYAAAGDLALYADGDAHE